jgi:hypothetical protein
MKYEINSKKTELMFDDLTIGDYFYRPVNFDLYRKYSISQAYNIDSNILSDCDAFARVIKLKQTQIAKFEREE